MSKNLDDKNLLSFPFSHLLACSIGWAGCLYSLGAILTRHWAVSINNLLSYATWAIRSLAASKPEQLAGYMIGVIGIFLYFVGMLFVFHKKICRQPKICNSPYYVPCLIVANTLLLGAFMLKRSFFLWAGLTLLWAILLLSPFLRGTYTHIPLFTGWKKLHATICAACVLIMVLAVTPYLGLTPLKIASDFLWAPETTLMKEGPVDNSIFIMQHGIGGLFDSRLITSKNVFNISKYAHIALTSCPTTLKKYVAIEPGERYLYECMDNPSVLLFKSEKHMESQVQNFCRLVSTADCQAIEAFPRMRYYYNDGELDFLEKNRFEISNNVIAGHYFHHQYAMLGPINELSLGKDSSQIDYLYGYGTTHLLHFLMDHVAGKISFEYYIASFYLFYPAYFILLFFVCRTLFRKDTLLTAITMTACTACFLLTGFEAIRMAPGFNPLRHFPDLLLILTFYKYLNNRHHKTWLSLSFLITAIAIINNTQFGLMMLAALTATSILHIFSRKKRLYSGLIVAAGLAVSLITFILLHQHTGKSLTALYVLLGVTIAPGHAINIITILLIIIASYAGIIIIGQKKGYHYPPLYLILLLFFHSQCLWLYYVWYSSPGHILITSTVWVLFFVYLTRELLLCFSKDPQKNPLPSVLFLCSCLLLLMAAGKYFWCAWKYNKIFSTHVVYHWDFPTARFDSTMNPAVFKEASDVINVYEKNNSIYIISRYDNFLPFIAGKYSAMPYLLLATSLVTQSEVDHAANEILTQRPKYLFVDSDIMDSHLGDIVDESTPLRLMIDPSWLSHGRVTVLNELQKVFLQVSSQYHFVKKTYLIAVYERNKS